MKYTILVVEDDRIQRRQMARVLTAEGYDVLEASSGLEAIRVLTEKDIQIVLTDLMMPEMDGVSLLKYIKTNYAQIPVGILTAHPGILSEDEPDAVLCKPFGEKQLKELVWLLTPEPAF